MGDQEMGEQELILAAKSDPENEELLHILGTYYSQTRSLDEYGNIYEDLLKRKPDSLSVKKKLTELLLMKGELQKAWKIRERDAEGPARRYGHIVLFRPSLFSSGRLRQG